MTYVRDRGNRTLKIDGEKAVQSGTPNPSVGYETSYQVPPMA